MADVKTARMGTDWRAKMSKVNVQLGDEARDPITNKMVACGTYPGTQSKAKSIE